MAQVGPVEKGPWGRSLRAILGKKKSGSLSTLLVGGAQPFRLRTLIVPRIVVNIAPCWWVSPGGHVKV